MFARDRQENGEGGREGATEPFLLRRNHGNQPCVVPFTDWVNEAYSFFLFNECASCAHSIKGGNLFSLYSTVRCLCFALVLN